MTPSRTTGVAEIRRSKASTHALQAGWFAGSGNTNGLLGTNVPVSVGAGPPRSCPIGLDIRQRMAPEHASAAPPPKKPQK